LAAEAPFLGEALRAPVDRAFDELARAGARLALDVRDFEPAPLPALDDDRFAAGRLRDADCAMIRSFR
jgi:hypothetical protein